MSGNNEQLGAPNREEFLDFMKCSYGQEWHDECAARIHERISDGTVQTMEQLFALFDDLVAEIFKRENPGIDDMVIGGDDCCDFDLVH